MTCVDIIEAVSIDVFNDAWMRKRRRITAKILIDQEVRFRKAGA